MNQFLVVGHECMLSPYCPVYKTCTIVDCGVWTSLTLHMEILKHANFSVPRGGSVFALERSVTTKIGGMKSFFQPNQLGRHAGFSCLNLRKEVDEFCSSLSHTYPNI